MKTSLILETDSRALGNKKDCTINDLIGIGAAIIALMGAEGKPPEVQQHAFELGRMALAKYGIAVQHNGFVN